MSTDWSVRGSNRGSGDSSKEAACVGIGVGVAVEEGSVRLDLYPIVGDRQLFLLYTPYANTDAGRRWVREP